MAFFSLFCFQFEVVAVLLLEGSQRV